MWYLLLVILFAGVCAHCDTRTWNGCDHILFTMRGNTMVFCNRTTTPMVGGCEFSDPNECYKMMDLGLSCKNVSSMGIELLQDNNPVDFNIKYQVNPIIRSTLLLPVYSDEKGYWNPLPGVLPVACPDSFSCFRQVCSLFKSKAPMILIKPS